MTTIILDGVTYIITDYDPNSGLTEADVENIIQNLHSTGAYKNEISNDIANSNDNVVDITIDGIDPTNGQKYSTQTVEVPTAPGEPNRHSVNINSDLVTDSAQNTYAEKDTGRNIQVDADTALAHEISHLHQERVGEDINGDGIADPSNGLNGNPSMGDQTADEEQYAREKTNKIREELGLPPREDFAGEGDNIADMDGDGDIDEDDAALDAADLDRDGDVDQDDADIQNAASVTAPDTKAKPYDPNYGNPPSTVIGNELVRPNTFPTPADFFNYFLSLFGSDKDTASPLVLDLGGNGIDLISLANSSVMWDIDEDLFVEKYRLDIGK